MLQLSSSSNRLRESIADFDKLAAMVSAEDTESFVKVKISGPIEALRGVVANEATASNRSACCVKYLMQLMAVIVVV